MGIIAFIILGAIAGAIAKALLPGDDPGGFIITTIIGIVGAILGGPHDDPDEPRHPAREISEVEAQRVVEPIAVPAHRVAHGGSVPPVPLPGPGSSGISCAVPSTS